MRKQKYEKIEMAATQNIDKYDAFSTEFIEKIFGLKRFLITDESSIYDFDFEFIGDKAVHRDMDKVLKKIKNIYGVDVSKIKGLKLYKIFDKIMEVNRSVAQSG